MRTTHKDLIQGTPDWMDAKLGKPSASKCTPLLAVKGLGKGAETYAIELIAEVLTGEPASDYTSPAMDWGNEHEPDAREIYERSRNVEVVQVGGIEFGQLWYSPDGLVGEDGLIEIKCPGQKQHLRTLLGEPIDKQYNDQMQFGMYVSGRMWCDFISFNPKFPAKLAAKVIRVMRDDVAIALIEQRTKQFKVLMDGINDKLYEI